LRGRSGLAILKQRPSATRPQGGAHSEEYAVRSHAGGDLNRYIPQLAQLRIRVFRDFPCLCEGDRDDTGTDKTMTFWMKRL